MDGAAWRAKCGPKWTTPLAMAAAKVPSPAPPLPSQIPSPLPPLPLPPPPAGNQMDRSSQQFFHSFNTQNNLEAHSTVQEQLIFQTLNLDFARSVKTELSNSFLALLSGHSHQLSSSIAQLPHLNSTTATLHSHSGGIISCASRAQGKGSLSLSENYVGNSLCFGEISPLVESRPFLVSTSSKSQSLHNGHQVAGSQTHGSGCVKPVPKQACKVKNSGISGIGTSSMSSGQRTVNSFVNSSENHMLKVQAFPKVPTEARSALPSHVSAFLKAWPHVLCMNKVGELRVSDNGRLGILCFCHGLHMSVAKFCQHSGSPSVNPGEAVYLENGMTIVQWYKLYFGNMALPDGNGWEWPDDSLAKGVLVGNEGNKSPVFTKAPGTSGYFQAVSGLGRPGEPSKKSIYINRPHTVGQTTLNNLANNNANFAFQTKSLEGHNLPFESLTGLAQSGMPLPKNNIVQGKKESPDHVVLDASNLTMNKSEQTVWPSVVASNVGFMGKFGNLTSRYPYSETKKSSTHEHILRRDNSSSKAFVADREGSSSNIDLMLGQPSHHFCTPLTSFPTVTHPLHVGVMCSSQKAQLNQTLAERSDHHRETKKARTQLQYIQSEASSSNRGQPQHELSHADPKGLTDDPTKSSLISLFLSHLNYGGYNSSESTDIVNNSMQSVTRVPDAESLSAKCNSLDHTNEAAGIEKKSFSNSFNIFDIVDAGKGPGLVATNSCNVVKANHLHDKQTADIGDLTPVIGGNGMHSTSCDIRQSSLHFNQPHNILKIRPDVSHSTQYVKAPFLGNMNHCSHAIHNSINSVSYATDEAGSLNSRTPSSFTSPNFAHIQETTCALSHQRHIDRSEKMMDEDLRFLRHMVELPKQDQCVASLTNRPQHPIVCCLSAMGSQGNVCKDLVAPEESGRGTQCSIQAHPSNQVIRSVRPCSECYSGIGVENLSAKPGPDECCNCTASAQTKSECSKEHNIQFSTCHVCGAADHPCLRFGRVLNSSSSGSVKHKMCNHKEQSPLFSGKCGCTVHSKSLGGCCFTGGDNPSDALIEQGDTRERTTPAYDEHFVFPDGKSLRVCQCECVKKHVLMKNKCHTGLWRDVPSKLQGHSDVPIPDKPAKKLEPSHLVRDLLVNTPKEFDGTQQVAELIDEQQMSSACSGSSAPAVTEVSVEVNDVDFGDMNIEDAKVMHDFVVDEGSGIEKCGSSDEATGIRECEEAMAMMEKVDPATCGYCLSSRLSGNLTDEHILKSSSKKRRTRNQNFFENITEENDNQTMQSERGRKIEKRKEQMKMNKLGVSVPESGFYSINSESPDCISHLKLEPSSPDRTKASPKSENMMQEASIFGRSLSAKRKRSVLRPRKTLSLDRSVNQRNTCGYDKMQLSNDDHCTRTLKISAEKAKKPEFSEDWVKPFTKQKENQKNGEKPLKYMSLSCIGKFHNHGMGTIGKNVRPVVCGESGIISNGLDGHQKPAKILPLKLILKKSKRCKITEYGGKPNLSSISKSKKVRASLDGEDCNEPLSSKLHSKDKDDSGRTRVKIDPSILLMSSTSKECSFDNERSIDECSVKICETDGVNDQMEKPALRHEHLTSQSKPKYKKVRKFHLSELMGKVKCEHPYSQSHGEDNSSKMIEEGNSLETPPTINIDDALVGTEHDEEKICSRFALSTNIRAEISSLDSQDHRGEACQVNTRRSSKDEKFQAFFVNSDAFCCVCGSSNQEDMNYLLECNRCLIRVHQACYGVPKIPRGYWFCRPCKINSQNIACVLCGYGGGAMTRAVKSQTVVKSLLKAWKVGTESNFAVPFPSSEIINNEFLKTSSVSEASEFDKSVSVPSSQSQDCTVRCLDSLSNNLQAYNSIVAGVLDPSVTQWVHMVCGLWTPGTRCPNVYTMSAFDVSGASPDRKKIVCSMCNRPGGSCIDCRVVDCSVQFHPWCAHQKGLLQSEIEGDDNENVGFYGRCIFHATQNGFHVDKQLGDAEAEILRSKDWTCARTEVFKGRKREDGFNPSHWKAYNDKGGCIVSQEQINAWLHINGQKTCARPVVKQGCSDIEYDFRKEYFRYKQSKGWKQLVVYKSGIHALGLYTSQFIYRGAMVVEYVGEIVGQRVADKREIEYQSGRRLQYKSACYFFRIDKEHIIDATCKGGIARFVNHSCLPNCVAKVISVRNEKKVVFFAERDIYPGEEITYDYHFNHEDEGQKIPCFCKSRNCRRYLN